MITLQNDTSLKHLYQQEVQTHIHVNVVQERLAKHIQISRLHGIMGHVKHEEVNSRLWWPQLGETKENADKFS